MGCLVSSEEYQEWQEGHQEQQVAPGEHLRITDVDDLFVLMDFEPQVNVLLEKKSYYRLQSKKMFN